MGSATVNDFYRERARHSKLRKALSHVVSRSRTSDGIPDVCRRLHRRAPLVGSAELGALILAACRWGEIETIDWACLTRHRYAFVTQKKTETRRRIKVPPQIDHAALRRVKTPVHLPLHSRKRVQSCIRKGMRAINLRPPIGIKSGTHIVRHLTATGLADAGWQIEDIADRLGHHDEESSRHYIHATAAWRTAS